MTAQTSALVGRDEPLRVLATAVDEAVSGLGRLVLVTGEAGIGKTTLLRAALEGAEAAGALVGAGACWDAEAAPGYWPWVQVLRALRLTSPTELWERAVAVAGSGLGWLLDEAGSGAEPGQQGAFEALDAVSTVLQVLSRERAVVVALEDLHWSDAASIDLLRALVRHASLESVLLVGTYRYDEVAAAEHPRSGDLARLAAAASSVPLSGLDLDAVGELLDRLDPPPETGDRADRAGRAREVERRTGGNPFFIEQVARLWALGGPTGAAPPGVRAAIERRMARLPSASAELLTAAAVLGTRFETALLAAVAGLEIDDIEPLLAPAVTANLVAADGAAHRFVHDLVREVLVGALDAREVRRLHAAAVDVLRRAPPRIVPDGPAVRATRIANHAVLAVPELSPATAAALSVEAATMASQRLAAEEAAEHLVRALDLLPDEDPQRRGLTVRLAAEHRRAGHLVDARATLDDLRQVARADGDSATFARAALGLHELGALIEDPEEQRMAWLNEAGTRLARDGAVPAEERDRLRARTLAAIARTRAHRLEDDRSGLIALSEESVALARRSGDDATLAFCLLAHHDALWGAVGPAERSAVVEEMARAAGRAGDIEAELQALLLQFVARLELGDPAAFTRFEQYRTLADRAGLPRCRYVGLTRLTTIAILRGRFDEAFDLGHAAMALGERLGEVDRGSVWCDQRWQLARLRGDADSAEALLREFSGDPHMVVVEMTIATDRGDLARAEELRAAVAELSRRWPRWAATLWLASQVELACLRGDLARCEQLRWEVAGHTEAWIVLAGAVIVHGPMARLAALCDAALGRWDDAVAGFEAAAAAALRLDARPWLVDARLGLASALVGRGAPGDVERARDLAETASSEAAALGMASATARADTLRAEAGGLGPAVSAGTEAVAAAVGATSAPVTAAPARFTLNGDVWTLAYGGLTVQAPGSKGLHDLRILLQRPGVDVAAVDLLGGDAPAGAGPSRRRGEDVLDESARTAYAQRIAELDQRIEQALARHADQRAADLDAERARLVAELRAATGLGGRRRRLGDDVERARKAVTARIRDAIRRLDGRHPALAEHFRASVSTGTLCRYQPHEPVAWET